jgi:methylated-DNA-[protein]-cysteine S-methyltransferase
MNPDPRATAFQEMVYDAVNRIPRGYVTNYAELARELDCGSPRAIGQALRKCFAPEVPCHRVISSDGSIGGFGGETKGPQVAKKLRMLKEEGVVPGPDGKIPAAKIFRFA